MNTKTLVALVADTASPAKELAAVDRYMSIRSKAPKRFALPDQDSHLAPVIKFIGNDLTVFRAFARLVRDECVHVYGEASHQYVTAQEFVRRLDIRFAAQKRRLRLQSAYEWEKIRNPDRSFEDRQRWLRRLEQHWAKQRRDALKDAKAQKGEALTREEKEDVLAQFWDGLDEQLGRGDLPTWDELMEV